MSKTGKIIWWAVAIVVPLGIIIYLINKGKGIWDKLSFKPYFISADLKGLTLADIPTIVAGEGKTINAKLGMEIKNDSSTAIPFCYLRAVLSYKGIEIARTSDNLAGQCSRIPAKGEPNSPLNVTDDVTIKLNGGGIALLTDKLLKKNPEIDYQIDLSVFGIPVSKIFPIKSKFPW